MTEFYFKKKSKQIADAERQYDSFIADEAEEKLHVSSYFLRKMREIIFCRKNGLPTTEKEKNLRAYRDADVCDK